ncbi:hypothetical protein BL254_07755 [Protofrankia sp. BMG5.30]|uniref:Uncharacterized protein n=1 Tax=Protofrankia coriariae TaxID=1562887 RepID=A0ABR5F7U9_9ACTN|nr:hypothetical protein FrCorBMG51_01240 [Protofrankia coriariae]ONH36352.1 hypothetical protein BL254_07755 [Protofrankia sp. BMG5.30]
MGERAPAFDEAWLAYRRHQLHGLMFAFCPPDMQPENVCAQMGVRYGTAAADLETLGVFELWPVRGQGQIQSDPPGQPLSARHVRRRGDSTTSPTGSQKPTRDSALAARCAQLPATGSDKPPTAAQAGRRIQASGAT